MSWLKKLVIITLSCFIAGLTVIFGSYLYLKDDLPSVETLKLGQEARTPAQWLGFTRKYRAEMAAPDHVRSIELLARLSHQSNFSIGCYCDNEARCHRSILRELLLEKGALVEPLPPSSPGAAAASKREKHS